MEGGRQKGGVEGGDRRVGWRGETEGWGGGGGDRRVGWRGGDRRVGWRGETEGWGGEGRQKGGVERGENGGKVRCREGEVGLGGWRRV